MTAAPFGHDFDGWRCKNCGTTAGTVGAMMQCVRAPDATGDRPSVTEPAEIDFARITAELSRG